MNPQIEFAHVLGELSVNRNDPCEVLRELISNSYDAGANNLHYVPIKDRSGFAFFDNGSGLDADTPVNGITPWEAFFSIGKSTKRRGDAIGYKCQGTKLCFASARILIAARAATSGAEWNYQVVENPRSNLDTNYDITPNKTKNIAATIDRFLTSQSADTTQALSYLKPIVGGAATGTLIVIDELDTENFGKYFAVGVDPEESYVFNYLRFYTRHGDVRYLTQPQGFTPSQRKQVSSAVKSASLEVYANKKVFQVPFGYPYLPIGKQDTSIKSPLQVSRLRDGAFYSRSAKQISVGAEKYSIVLAIDGNRRAHAEYKYLARKGKAMSGIKLSDHRGVFVAVKGIKICKYQDLLTMVDGYEVLSEGDSPSHYSLIIEGDFDLVTNRNALSKKAYDTLSSKDFLDEMKKFLDHLKSTDTVFSELLARLRRESSENLLNEQISILDDAKAELKIRERFRIVDPHGKKHLFLSPQPGEEYLVGVLYSQLSNLLPNGSALEKYWRRVITFSTQGIDSLGLRNETASNPLAEGNICSIEYKYEFHNFGPFNHALAVVDYIVAWSVDVDVSQKVKDTFTCFGDITKVAGNDFEWEISNMENLDGGSYNQKITVICLKDLIAKTFNTTFALPPS